MKNWISKVLVIKSGKIKNRSRNIGGRVKIVKFEGKQYFGYDIVSAYPYH